MKPNVLLTVLALVLGSAITGSTMLHRHLKRPDPFDAKAPPIPVKRRLSGDLHGISPSGATLSFSENTAGKVTVCAYLWTSCPEGCANVFLTMKELREFFAADPGLQLVSVAVLPDLDPPHRLAEFALSQGIKDSPAWLFFSGFSRQAAWTFMHEQLLLNPTTVPTFTEESPPCCRRCDHDLRVVLIDRQQRVRGLYPGHDPAPDIREFFRAKLFGDVSRLLADSE